MAGEVSLIGSVVLALLLAGYLGQQYLPPPKPRVLGLDLGTTFCSVAVFQPGSGQVEVIPDEENRRSIPSVVAFTSSSVLVGHEAVEHSQENPQNTIYDAKRFIGKRFQTEVLQQESSRYPFKVLSNNGSAEFQISVNGTFSVSPEWVGSRLLLRLRTMAERHLGVSVQSAVISVPAEFDENQRNATVKAANLAGLQVLRVISEPTAAAMAYGLHKVDVVNVLVVDLGGGTLDVSLLLKQGGMFLTRAMAGNNQLGGQDFSQRLLTFVSQRVQEDLGAPPLKEDLYRLHLAVEEAKLNLTVRELTTLRLRLRGGASEVLFTLNITRAQFEQVNEDLFQKVLSPVVSVLSEGGLDRSEVDEVVLVGGSTRIPRIRQIITDFFGKVPNTSVDPDLAVVTGVAIQAGIMGGAWPLQVSAIEVPNRHLRKRNLN